MTVAVRIVTPAQRDLMQMTKYLAERDLRVAVRFRRAVKEILDRLATSPERGSLCGTRDVRLSGLRVSTIRGFPRHLVFHRSVNAEIVILRVLHASQDASSIFGPFEETTETDPHHGNGGNEGVNEV